MEGKCRKCERVTKYEFLACFAEKFREDHDNYSEEEKLIGNCKNCDGNLVVVKATTNARRIFWQKKQTDEHSKRQQKPTDSNRMVTVDTVEKSWKNVVLAKYATND